MSAEDPVKKTKSFRAEESFEGIVCKRLIDSYLMGGQKEVDKLVSSRAICRIIVRKFSCDRLGGKGSGLTHLEKLPSSRSKPLALHAVMENFSASWSS